MKAVAKQSPKELSLVQQNPEVNHETDATKETHIELAVTKLREEECVEKRIDGKWLLVSEEEVESFIHDEQNVKETAVVTDNIEISKSKEVRNEVVQVKPQEVNNDAMKEKKVEAGNITVVENENSDHLKNMSNSGSKGASGIEVQEDSQATSPDLNPVTTSAEDSNQLLNKDVPVSKEKFTEGDEKQHELLGSNTVSKPIPTEERQDETETGNESTKKLSADAPPFSPSITPVFGSVPVPCFKDHGGILPPTGKYFSYGCSQPT